MGSSRKPEVDIGLLSSWCQQQYDSGIDHIIFEGGYSSSVVGVMLVNGNPVVVKIRRTGSRLHASGRHALPTLPVEASDPDGTDRPAARCALRHGITTATTSAR